MIAPKIMVVEDEEPLCVLLRYNLEAEGYQVEIVNRGDEAELRLQENVPDLLVLDWMVPAISGIELCRRLRMRPETERLPIIMLTARGEESDRVRGLSTGADDYLVKPVDLRELSARCRALIRRTSGEASSVVQYGNLRFDRAAAQVQVNGISIDLPRREFCVLDLLLRHQGKTLSKARIIEQLCSFDGDEAPSDNAIELYIARLRKKLGHSTISIRTLRGIGYILHVDTRT